ncbi:1-(5-phosphoribosyl)-5-[(5-phosphoribosylamino)methylideneamino]imidazole-4-carboxamide isomerase [soil metagenome]
MPDTSSDLNSSETRSFKIIPCVDIQNGTAVRLFEGDPERETVYFDSPVAAARHWAGLGAARLHLVDLDAALGKGDNSAIVREIARTVDAKLELGGGIRSLDTALEWLQHLDRVVLGTLAVTAPETVDALLKQVAPERVVVSIDARNGRVAVKGWAETSDVAATTLAARVAAQGVTQIIYTDVSRDGTLRGVDAEPVMRMREAFPHTLIAGGGVASDADLVLYERLGLDGAIVGRALYEGKSTYPPLEPRPFAQPTYQSK